MPAEKKKKKLFICNLLFAVLCGGLLFVLWHAPPETTARVPHDANHSRFAAMQKKEAESHCGECHGSDKIPLPKNHPQPYRCLFCHKRA